MDPQRGKLALLVVVALGLAFLAVGRGRDVGAEESRPGSRAAERTQSETPAGVVSAGTSAPQAPVTAGESLRPADPSRPMAKELPVSEANPRSVASSTAGSGAPAAASGSGGSVSRAGVRGPKMNLSRPPIKRPTDGRPVLLTAMGDTIPYAPMGEPIRRSPLEDAPGYQRVVDPESTAVLTGRRVVATHDRALGEGARSAEELAIWILDALRESDREQLKALAITAGEFGEILWPEFPESRPITRLEAKDAWFFLERTSLAGINQALNLFGGVPLEFERITYEVGFAPYTNFALYHGVRIHATRPEGDSVVLDFADSFVECRGTWKVYIYKD